MYAPSCISLWQISYIPTDGCKWYKLQSFMTVYILPWKLVWLQCSRLGSILPPRQCGQWWGRAPFSQISMVANLEDGLWTFQLFPFLLIAFLKDQRVEWDHFVGWVLYTWLAEAAYCSDVASLWHVGPSVALPSPRSIRACDGEACLGRVWSCGLQGRSVFVEED